MIGRKQKDWIISNTSCRCQQYLKAWECSITKKYLEDNKFYAYIPDPPTFHEGGNREN